MCVMVMSFEVLGIWGGGEVMITIVCALLS